jgi:hypothetical protein
MKMRTHILATTGMAVALGLAASSSAVSQPAPGPSPPSEPVAPIFAGAPPPTAPPVELSRRPGTLHEREDRLDAVLDADLHDGTLDQAVGERARMELDSIRYDEDRLRHENNGALTDADAFQLDARLEKVSQIVRGHPAATP